MIDQSLESLNTPRILYNLLDHPIQYYKMSSSLVLPVGDVLDDLVDGMPHVRGAVGVGRAVVQHELGPPLPLPPLPGVQRAKLLGGNDLWSDENSKLFLRETNIKIQGEAGGFGTWVGLTLP